MSDSPIWHDEQSQSVTSRGSDGRFLPGNPGGRGNPLAGAVGRLRGVLLSAVTPDDMSAIVGALVAAAKGGDVHAAKLIFAYTLGQPQPADLIEQLSVVQERLAVMEGRDGNGRGRWG